MFKVFVCLLLALVVAVSAQDPPSSFLFDGADGGAITVKQGMMSDYIFIETADEPVGTIHLSWGEEAIGTNPLGGLGFTSTDFTFSATQRSTSFRINSAENNGTFSIKFTSDDTTRFPSPASIGVSVEKRLINIENFPSVVYVGQPSSPIQVSLEYPASTDITLTPQTRDRTRFLEDQYLIFMDAQITIPAGSLVGSFVYMAKNVTGPVYISWDVTGGDSKYYIDGYNLNENYNFQFRERTVSLPDVGITAEAIIGEHGTNYLYVYVRQTPNNTISITPNAADTTFSPSTLNIDPNQNWVRFSYVTTSPEAQKKVYWYLQQNGENYADIAPTMVNVPKRIVFPKFPASTLTITNTTYFTVAIPYPTMNSLTVSFYASHCTFPTSSVTFTKDKNITSFSVPIVPRNLGPDQIRFKLSGPDADWYDDIAEQDVSVAGGQFVSPSNWYTPYLFIGQQSPQIPVRASFSPMKTVTLTPSAPNLRFDPATLTFRNGSELQYFRITPLYTNNVETAPGDDYTVNFLVSGDDNTWFSAPAPMTVQVYRRFIQTSWSAHLENQYNLDSTSDSRHLGKTYKVWVSANYVGDKDAVTVTPVSPYFSFNPKVVKFSSKTTRVLLEATVTGVVGSTPIDYIIGGNEGGYYQPITADTVTTALRPLAIQAVQLAPDTRLPHKKAGLVEWNDLAGSLDNYLQGVWTVYSFRLSSSVLPDGGLTITPKCAHAKFHPESISLGGKDVEKRIEYAQGADIHVNGYPSDHNNLFNPHYNFTYYFNNTNLYLSANFTVEPLAGGIHLVNFELSGKDAGFYDVPSDVAMRFRTVDRDSNEPVQSAAGAVFPSIVVFVAVICALFM